jgi:glycine/D-amino acid oxidase-like deaminating enzyme
MLNAPATGELLAELITGRASTTLDPTPFAASRPGLA